MNPPNDGLIRCSRCQQFKPPDSFNWRRKRIGQRDSYCRPCRADYKQEHYAANRQRYMDHAGKRRRAVRAERMAYLAEFFETRPCVDCGETDLRVLEFDHRGDKSFNVGYGLQRHAWPRVLAEIDKCDVRCANCHRRKTARTRGFSRARLREGRGDSASGPHDFEAE